MTTEQLKDLIRSVGYTTQAQSMEIAQALEAALTERQEPLYLLHTGAIDSDGEQDEFDAEPDSYKRVEAYCRANPGITVGLYPHPTPVNQQLLEALKEIEPFIPVTSASEGGAAKYSANVRAADKVRAAIAAAEGKV